MPLSAPVWLRPALAPAACIAATTVVLLALFPPVTPSFDTAYLLLWGRQIASFASPSQAAQFAPTPHPLFELFGAVVSPLGEGAWTATRTLAYLSLGLAAYFVYRLGTLWFDRPIGVLAALILMTRPQVLSDGLQAYVDLPFLALCLGALLIETRRPRAGWPVLVLLALAGLLRPEAWLYSLAYLGYLLVGDRNLRSLPPLVALALAGPVGWLAFDLITTGNPLFSLTGTQATVEALGRETGLGSFITAGPRHLGTVLGWPAATGALAGVALGFAALRRRSVTALVSTCLVLLAFALVACAGLAILPRYAMPAASLLAIFASLALLGWRLVDRSSPWRRPWQAVGVIVGAMFLVWAPHQYGVIADASSRISARAELDESLQALIDDGDLDPHCGPVSIPNQRAAPRLAFWLDLGPGEIVSPPAHRQPATGHFLAAGNRFTVEHYLRDPIGPVRESSSPPAGFEPVSAGGAWRVFRRC